LVLTIVSVQTGPSVYGAPLVLTVAVAAAEAGGLDVCAEQMPAARVKIPTIVSFGFFIRAL
jgi:hypothetical protein